jgi:hypothetical protein
MKPIDYYENENGSYQYVPISVVIDDFLYETTDDDSILKNTRRTKIVKHAKDALRELNKSTFNEEKATEITVPESLYVVLPHDFVSEKRVSVIVYDELSSSLKLLPLNKNTNIHISVGVLQNNIGDLLFDVDGKVLNTDGSNAYAKPFKTYQFVQNQSDHEKFGEYVIDKNRGRILFSSDLALKDIVLQYRTDGLQFDKYGEDEIRVHKDMIQVLKDLMFYTLIRMRQGVSRGDKMDALNRFKTTRHEAKLESLKLNLVDIFRGGRNPKY